MPVAPKVVTASRCNPLKRTFPPEARLHSASEFTRVYRHGRRLRSGRIQIRIAPNDLGYPRLGLAIAKRVYKRAVDRNAVKRYAREAFRRHRTELPACDIIVHVQPGRITVPPQELVPDLLRALSPDTLN